MDPTQRLLGRLDAIGRALEATSFGVALLGLGSVGTETHRLDAYSDLDFFAIVQPGYKHALLDTLDWLAAVHPIAFAFRNTGDGYKVLFADGIFCEFGVFEAAELPGIAFTAGRIVWKAPEVGDAIAIPARTTAEGQPRSRDWLVGEALTNLYVGLGRNRRGERLSASRFIQGYAVDRVVELAALLDVEQPASRDRFAPERRFEQRFPRLVPYLPRFMQGYDRNVESAREILHFLEQHVEVNPALRQAILDLCDDPA